MLVVGVVTLQTAHHSNCAISEGLQSGGTIGMWQSYFGDARLTYYGVDIDGYCR